MVGLAPEMTEMRVYLSQALSIAERSGEPVAWARTAQALGHVCQRLRSQQMADGQNGPPGAILLPPAVPAPGADGGRRQLKESLIEMLTLADALDEPAVAIHLNQALLLLTGSGMLQPEGA